MREKLGRAAPIIGAAAGILVISALVFWITASFFPKTSYYVRTLEGFDPETGVSAEAGTDIMVKNYLLRPDDEDYYTGSLTLTEPDTGREFELEFEPTRVNLRSGKLYFLFSDPDEPHDWEHCGLARDSLGFLEQRSDGFRYHSAGCYFNRDFTFVVLVSDRYLERPFRYCLRDPSLPDEDAALLYDKLAERGVFSAENPFR